MILHKKVVGDWLVQSYSLAACPTAVTLVVFSNFSSILAFYCSLLYPLCGHSWPKLCRLSRHSACFLSLGKFTLSLPDEHVSNMRSIAFRSDLAPDVNTASLTKYFCYLFYNAHITFRLSDSDHVKELSFSKHQNSHWTWKFCLRNSNYSSNPVDNDDILNTFRLVRFRTTFLSNSAFNRKVHVALFNKWNFQRLEKHIGSK